MAISRTTRTSFIHFYGAGSGSSKRSHDLSHALPFLNNVHELYARAGNEVTVATNAPAPMNIIMAEALATQSLICLSTHGRCNQRFQLMAGAACLRCTVQAC